jgi:probable F420-dependent oxidoreductase
MLVDYFYGDPEPQEVAAVAAAVEARGYDGLWFSEASHDSFIAAAVAAGSTERLQLGSSVAIAFARSPMITAYAAWDAADYSNGRYALGLGAAARAQIEDRYSMPWGDSTERMEEYVQALGAIWHTWRTGEPLAFTGKFTTHTSMDRVYRPKTHEHEIPILLAAVSPPMIEAAARCADGIILHPLTTRAALDDAILPALDRGLREAGRERSEITVAHLAMTVIADDPRAEEQMQAVRGRIAWYAERKQYGPLLRGAGRPDLGAELRSLREAGKRREIPGRVDDDLVESMAVVAKADDLASAVLERFGHGVDRIAWLYDWLAASPDAERRMLDGLRAAPRS